MRIKPNLPHCLISTASLLALAFTVSACAGAATARDVSSIGAKMTNDFKTDTQNFFTAQDAMTQGAVKTIAERKQFAAELDNQTRVRRASWQAANNTNAIRIYDSLSTQSDTSILTGSIELQSLQPLPLPTSTTIDPKQFDSVTQTLNQMAKPPTLKDQVSFLVTEGQDVAKQYKQSLNKGTKCTNKAAGANKQPVSPASNVASAGNSQPGAPTAPTGCTDAS